MILYYNILHMMQEDQDPNTSEFTKADADFATVLLLLIVFGIAIFVVTL